MSCHPRTRAFRRYNIRVIWLSLGYAAAILFATYAFRHHLLSGAIVYLIAVLPALPIIGMFVAMGRYITEETDEYQRLLLTRQMLWATGFALSVATVWGFLQAYDLIERVDGYWVVVLWYFGLGLGSVANAVIERRAA
ncbi:hypothetical protein [Sphingomonas immobilis]|uniref:DUF2178 domain-containing protein n=1 Tax=Sphingomonas immobilis TaxID=3063997 RepID=A0ABT9A684_9SPHN|nr:hypothetical protein [Sphingomonas sp. CA1-15]MDO7844491.1 hypothetical protein [Sphingomonas sp. CA1-15]